jgi:hypothetical protein
MTLRRTPSRSPLDRSPAARLRRYAPLAVIASCVVGTASACGDDESSPAAPDASTEDVTTTPPPPPPPPPVEGGEDAGPACQVTNPSSDPSSRFGAEVHVLTNGNVVVSDPALTVDGQLRAGAVYLFDGKTCALISKLTGSVANEGVGATGIGVLTNGNFVVMSNYGAHDGSAPGFSATFFNGTTGFGPGGAVVSAANSLVPSGLIDGGTMGSTAVPCLTGQPALPASTCQAILENILTANPATTPLSASGSRFAPLGLPPITNDMNTFAALSNGNYIIASPGSNAMTVGSGTTGVSGVISPSNSLIASDGVVGFGPYPGGILSPCLQVPAACGSSLRGTSGILAPTGLLPTATNVFASVVGLPNGHFVTNAAGAIVLHDGTTGAPLGSLSGGTAASQIVPLASGNNFVVITTSYAGGAGAVTLVSGTTGLAVKDGSTSISSANSLVGASATDAIGSGGVTALSNGNFVVNSPSFASGQGAATWCSGTAGTAATVDASNSLVGSAVTDHVGAKSVALTGGGYVVVTSDFGGGYGAVTFGNGSTGAPTGAIGVGNSLMGATAADHVGSAGVVPLRKGAYVVVTPLYGGGAGAITFGSGATGVSGTVSAANSLVGAATTDGVGSAAPITSANPAVGTLLVTPLTNGGYVVYTRNFSNAIGAVTFGNGTSGVSGAVSAANSLVGSNASDGLAGAAITALANGDYVVASPVWSGGKGAVTWGSGTTGVAGVVSAANSLVGASAGDRVGGGVFSSVIVTGRSGPANAVPFPPNSAYQAVTTTVWNGVVPLAKGHYVVMSPAFGGGLGAATFGGDTGVSGVTSASNSLVGSTPGDHVSGGGVQPLPSGNYVVMSPFWSNGSAFGAGAATFGGPSGVVGAISPANSLVGASAGDFVGFTGTNFLGGLPGSSNPSLTSAAVYLTLFVQDGGSGNGRADMAQLGIGVADGGPAGPPIVYGQIQVLSTGDYVVQSPYFGGERGAATLGTAGAGVSGTISASNSLVGTVDHGFFGAFVEEGKTNRVWVASGMPEMARRSADVVFARIP